MNTVHKSTLPLIPVHLPLKPRIASGSGDNTVQVWDSSNGENAYTYRGQSGVVLAVAWSPDGRRIASGSDDNTVQVWQAL